MRYPIVVVLLVCMVLGTPAFSDVTGKVVNKDGDPIPKAKVLAIWTVGEEREMKIVYSNDSGVFTFPASEENWYRVYATAQNYAFGVASKPSDAEEEFVVTLTPEQRLQGRVVDEAGMPVEGAKVALRSFSGWGMESSTQFSLGEQFGSSCEAVTGKDGKFTILHLPSLNEYQDVHVSFRVTSPGRAARDLGFTLRSSQVEQVISLPVGCELEGTLYLPGKTEPAPEGTSLFLRMTFPGEEGRWYTRGVRVGKEGKFKASDLPPGKVDVMMQSTYAQSPQSKLLDWTLRVTQVDTSPKEVAQVELELEKGAVISGKVTNKETGEPVQAYLSIRDAGRLDGSRLQTDLGGKFQARVASGEVSVSVVNMIVDNRHLDVSADEESSAVFSIADDETRTDIALGVAPSAMTASMDVYELIQQPIPDDFELIAGTYELEWDSELDCSNVVRLMPSFEGDNALSRIRRLPALVSEKPKYEIYALDGTGIQGLLAVVYDESQGTGKGYDTAYIDTNRNADLSDDEPVKWSATGDYWRMSPWVAVQSRQGPIGRGQTRHPVQVSVTSLQQEDMLYFRLQRKGGWRGKIASSAGEIECLSIDCNSNGIYGESVRMRDFKLDYESWDMVFTDTNGAGRAIAYPFGSHFIVPSEAALVGGTFYSVSTSKTGNTVTIDKYTGPVGKLVVRASDIGGLSGNANRYGIMSERGLYMLEDCGTDPIELPAGKCKIAYASIVLGEEPDGIQISCAVDEVTEIAANRETVVEIAGDIEISINPKEEEMTMARNTTKTVNWVMKIGDKASVSNLSSKPPQVKLFDQKGEVVHQGTAGST